MQRGFYAWNRLHAGSFLVFVDSEDQCYKFVFLPGPSVMHLTAETFEMCIKNNTLEFVEQLPEDIFQDVLDQYQKNVVQSTNKMYSNTDET